ncbi:Histone-lysine N-methyltransferase SUV39H2 [Orchesella cincta]|uniref:Histone-lysine N-methyltransferase n=1 Tax=Orchesella cincta TaxID=48709 RepID=A0A1D2MWF4_ORCCI|nr:Histone-lysine N-methyltransferase SUV39H2 [Orchesella cincta]
MAELSGKKEVAATSKGRRNSLPTVMPRKRRFRGSIRNMSLDAGRRAAAVETTPQITEGQRRRTRKMEALSLSVPEGREAKKQRAANLENVEQEQTSMQTIAVPTRKFGITVRAIRRSERTKAKTPNGSFTDDNGSDSGISVSTSFAVPSKPGSESDLMDATEVPRPQTSLVAVGTFEAEAANGEETEYEIEKFLNFGRDVNGNGLYLVKWLGYPKEFNTWEPERNLEECQEKILAFFKKREKAIIKAVKPAENVSEALEAYVKRRPMPNDPRPFHERTKIIFELTFDADDKELFEAAKQLETLKQKNRWSVQKVDQFLIDIMNGNQALGNPVVARNHFLYAQAEYLRNLQLKNLKKWEVKLNKITEGRPRITVENNADLVGPPKDFTYINDYVPGKGVKIGDDPKVGCHCRWTCFKRKKCCPHLAGTEFAYNKKKKLRVSQGTAIYECNKLCKCDSTCFNRVVQDGWTTLADMQMCIFRTTNNCGWGVKTLKPVKNGTFVALYAGEIITTAEAEMRGKEYDRLGQTYLFDLDFNKLDCPYVVDAARKGNISHFINHSCEPNLAVFNVWFNNIDRDMPKLALFTIRDVAKGEELTFDYVTNLPKKYAAKKDAKEKDRAFSSRKGARYPCLCGTPSCRKILF